MKGAYFHAIQRNGQISHTSVGPQKLRWPRAPRSLNAYLHVTTSTNRVKLMAK